MTDRRTRGRSDNRGKNSREWTFLTNHAHVLACIKSDPKIRMRDIAMRVGITERAVQRIAADLERGGYTHVIRHGRRNHYRVHKNRRLRHPIESHRRVADLLNLLADDRP